MSQQVRSQVEKSSIHVAHVLALFVRKTRVALQCLASAAEDMPPWVRPECREYASAGAATAFRTRVAIVFHCVASFSALS